MKSYDALPLLDSEYNHPAVKNVVLQAIEEEMKAFQPPKDNYLSTLPYPKLRFGEAPGFAQEYERINKLNNNNSNTDPSKSEAEYSMQKLIDTSRYRVAAPSGAAEQDPRAWHNSIANCRAQYEHQKNRIMNLELELEHGEGVWKQFNGALEGAARQTERLTESAIKDKNIINSQRIHNQKVHAPQLGRVTGKRNETLVRTLNLQSAINSTQTQATHTAHKKRRQE